MSDRFGTPTAEDHASASAPPAREVWGVFHDHEQLEEAVSWLEGALFVRADMYVVFERHGRHGQAGGSPHAATVDGDEARARDLGRLRALADLAAEGLAVLTGAAASAAVAAAARAGGVAPAATDMEGVIVAVRADRPCEAERAREVLCMAGANRIWTRDRLAGGAP